MEFFLIYGYAFVHDSWYTQPNSYYMKFPAVDIETINKICKGDESAEGSLDTRYSLYVYARQTGKWLSMLIDNSIEDFYTSFSFKKTKDFTNFPPVLLAHSFHDPDVSFSESQILSSLLPNSNLFVSSIKAHDFDKDTSCEDTLSLIEESLNFIKVNL